MPWLLLAFSGVHIFNSDEKQMSAAYPQLFIWDGRSRFSELVGSGVESGGGDA